MKNVKKKSRIQMAREIIANLKQGMEKRRLAEPVQSGVRESMPLAPARARFQPSRPMQTSSS